MVILFLLQGNSTAVVPDIPATSGWPGTPQVSPDLVVRSIIPPVVVLSSSSDSDDDDTTPLIHLVDRVQHEARRSLRSCVKRPAVRDSDEDISD